MLLEVELPVISPGTGWSFMEVARRRGDYALMGVAVLVSLDDQDVCTGARIVFLNAGDRPVEAREAGRALVGESLDDPAIVASAHSQQVDRGKRSCFPAYQRHLLF
jgi:carbon-monoxide dehydrogenase medium subunit